MNCFCIFAKSKRFIGLKKEKKDNSFIKKPYFEGGDKALIEFILKHLQYPIEAKNLKIQGIVVVRCDIDYKGSIHHVQVLKGIGHGCDEEALRIAKLIEFKVPKSPRGLKVTFHKDLRIPFQLIKETPKMNENASSVVNAINLNYNIVSTIKEYKNGEEKEKTIQYTITL